VLGYVHYDSEGSEPELHRIYVDASRKRGGVGSALMEELHARFAPGATYVLLVAEANRDARAFYERHGLVVDRHVDGSSWYSSAMAIDVAAPPPPVSGLLMRFTKPVV
jgi:ribosomal protein S18 acetylase RimI-like enzyme